MKLNYNKEENLVQISDTFKTQYWITNVTVIFAIMNCIIFPVFILEKKHMESFGFIWIILGIFLAITLIYQIIKISASNKLKLSEIHSVNEKQFFGRKRISLKLENGKSRDLIDVKNEADLRDVKNFFKNIGIATI